MESHYSNSAKPTHFANDETRLQERGRDGPKVMGVPASWSGPSFTMAGRWWREAFQKVAGFSWERGYFSFPGAERGGGWPQDQYPSQYPADKAVW